MSFSGTPFNTLVLVFVASTLLAVGMGTTGTMLRRTIGNARLLLGALAANLILIPALGWGLVEILAPDGPTFIALVLAAASPGGPFGAKLAQIGRLVTERRGPRTGACPRRSGRSDSRRAGSRVRRHTRGESR